MSNYQFSNQPFISRDKHFYKEMFKKVHDKLRTNSSIQEDCIGKIREEEIKEVASIVNQLALEINVNASIVIVVGEGNSYHQTLQVFKELERQTQSFLSSPEIFFVSADMGASYVNQLIDFIGSKDVYLYGISSSANTQSIWFRYLSAYMERRYGSESSKRIIVGANSEKSIIKRKTTERELRKLVLPVSNDMGSSILSPVGLLPLALAGCDIDALLNGAKQAVLDVDI